MKTIFYAKIVEGECFYSWTKKLIPFKNLCLEILILNGEIDWEKEYFTPIVSWENTLWTIWIPHSIDFLLPIRKYRLPKEPFLGIVEICENRKFCERLRIFKKVCKNCEKYYSLFALYSKRIGAKRFNQANTYFKCKKLLNIGNIPFPMKNRNVSMFCFWKIPKTWYKY